MGGRPRPKIARKSAHLNFLGNAKAIAGMLSKKPGVVGVFFSGGASRGYADELSDLDLTVILTHDAYRRWTDGLEAPVPVGTSLYMGNYCEFAFADVETWKQENWPNAYRWDLSYAKLLYDPKGILAKRIGAIRKPKLEYLRKYFDERDLASKVWWFPDVSRDWVERGDLVTAQEVLNESVHGIIELLYLLNREYAPYEKWTWHMAKSLNWKPDGFEEKMKKAIVVKSFTKSDIMRRAEALREIGIALRNRTVSMGFKSPDERAGLLWMFRKKKFTPDEFRKAFPMDTESLGGEPASMILSSEKKKGKLVLNVDFDKVEYFMKHRSKLLSWKWQRLNDAYAAFKKRKFDTDFDSMRPL